MCIHDYVYKGLFYYDDPRNRRSGSGAVVRTYYDVYYCRLCLEEIKKKHPTGNTYGDTSYDNPLIGSLPFVP